MNPQLIAYQAVPPTQPAAAPNDGGAPAASGGAPPGGLGSLSMFLIFLPLIALLFWQSRSAQKKQEQAIAALKKGDRVVTQAGLVGRLLEIDARYARLELAPGVKVQVLRSSLTGRDAEDSAKTAEGDKKDADKKDADKKESDK